MCGIFTVVSKKQNGLDISACKRGLSKLSWRGPDYSTYFLFNNEVFLGQSILSITGEINSDKCKHLQSKSGRFQLGYNGEIYNYKELHNDYLKDHYDFNNQATDSEILVNLFEKEKISDVISILDGMYSIVLLDKKNKELTISRDIQGEKSLYIYEDSDIIIISSEIRPIIDFVPTVTIDKQSLRDYFHTRHLLQLEKTIYNNIIQIPPGNYRTLDLQSLNWSKSYQISMSNWISPEKMEKYLIRSEEDILDELEAIMIKCIKQMIPNRSYASVLSGGIDSSLISAFLLKYGNPEMLIAVNHLGKDSISNDLKGFEKHLDKKINVIDVDLPKYSAEIERCQKACAGPLFSHSFIGQSIQSSYVRSEGCRVLFGGEGADEIFGGYSAYFENRSDLNNFSNSPYTNFFETPINFLNNNNDYIKNQLEEAWDFSLKSYNHLTDINEKIAQSMMFCDLVFQVSSVGLRGADLMSMMWSVETRSIFLRKPIVELGLNLPVKLKSDKNQKNPLLKSKYLLKKLFLRYYPEELIIKKQGFSGFPNESAVYLGEIKDFLVFDYLEISKKLIENQKFTREIEWKLINIEHFLRNSSSIL